MIINRNIIQIIEAEGIQLKKIGSAYRCCCPFHEDRQPSFYVYTDSNRFICYGCGEKGDAIDFIRKLKGFTFKEAAHYLGLNGKDRILYKSKSRQNIKRQRRQSFYLWCDQYYDELATEYRCINKVISTFKTMEQAEQFTSLYHRLPELEWRLDILLYGDDEEKFNLYLGEQDGL